MTFDKSKVYTALNADELKVGDKVFVADNIAELRRIVEKSSTKDARKIVHIRKDNEPYRFCVKSIDAELCFGFNLAYLVERAEENEEI
ncbi:hypothetical protein [Treponema berlinense]|uniref:hypothetical protein n=1 Tax=Treponema berlinense TaxID=225004 RepID=UPI003FD809C3